MHGARHLVQRRAYTAARAVMAAMFGRGAQNGACPSRSELGVSFQSWPGAVWILSGLGEKVL
jgi:hypothetical protein